MLKQHLDKRWGWLAAMATLAALLLSASAAGAHELPRERTLLVQVSHDSVEVMIVYLEPPGPSIDLLLRRYDLDGDGELVDAEADLAGREWIRRAMHGLQFEVEGERPQAKAPEIKFRREQKGALSAAVYARWELPEMSSGQTRAVHVRLLREVQNVATEINMRGGTRTDVASVHLPDRLDGLPLRPVLLPGEQATVEVRMISSPPHTTSKASSATSK